MSGAAKTYSGRVEYRAVQEEVEKKLAAGHRVRPIYEALVGAGKLTMSYSNFCTYVRGQGERRTGRKQSKPLRPSFNSDRKQAARSNFEPAKAQGFTHEKVADLDELGPPGKAR